MQSSQRQRFALAIIAGVTALPSPAMSATSFHDTFDDTTFFGDSLTDSGYFRPAIGELLSLSATQQDFIGRFTTNPGPVWAEHVAANYASNAAPSNAGGDNYAVGGARVIAPSSSNSMTSPSLSDQVATYLSRAGGVDDNALYSVWGGGNDLFAVTEGADVETTIASAVAGEIELITKLENAGARYVLLMNVPDLGLAPSYNDNAIASATVTGLAKQYNAELYSAARIAGVKVIPVDTYSLLQEVIASPEAYGFTNVTDEACSQKLPLCNSSTLVEEGANETYVFADGVHPSTATHRIFGEHIISLLEAPQLQQLLTHSVALSGQSRANRVAEHLNAVPLANGMRWWGDLRSERQQPDSGDLYDTTMPAGLLGLDWFLDGGGVLGGFIGYGDQDAGFGGNRGDFQYKDTTVGLFSGWYTDTAWINAQLSYSWLDYDIDRKVQLGNATRHHRGSPNGDSLTAAINAGYEFRAFSIPEGEVKTGPITGMTWQKIKLDGYDEEGQPSTSLSYPDQDIKSLVGRVGWQIRRNGPTINPYLQLAYNHEFEESHGVEATLQSLSQLGAYEVPKLTFDRDYFDLTLGARASLWDFDTQVGASVNPDDARTSMLFLNLGKRI